MVEKRPYQVPRSFPRKTTVGIYHGNKNIAINGDLRLQEFLCDNPAIDTSNQILFNQPSPCIDEDAYDNKFKRSKVEGKQQIKKVQKINTEKTTQKPKKIRKKELQSPLDITNEIVKLNALYGEADDYSLVIERVHKDHCVKPPKNPSESHQTSPILNFNTLGVPKTRRFDSFDSSWDIQRDASTSTPCPLQRHSSIKLDQSNIHNSTLPPPGTFVDTAGPFALTSTPHTHEQLSEQELATVTKSYGQLDRIKPNDSTRPFSTPPGTLSISTTFSGSTRTSPTANVINTLGVPKTRSIDSFDFSLDIRRDASTSTPCPLQRHSSIKLDKSNIDNLILPPPEAFVDAEIIASTPRTQLESKHASVVYLETNNATVDFDMSHSHNLTRPPSPDPFVDVEHVTLTSTSRTQQESLKHVSVVHSEMKDSVNFDQSNADLTQPPPDTFDGLLSICSQDAILTWTEFLKRYDSNTCVKLGEGVYGEVYRLVERETQMDVAMKVFPFFDSKKFYKGLVNGERMKNSIELIPEVVITKSLSDLAKGTNMRNTTPSFINLVQVAVVNGKYPNRFITEWKKYGKRKKTHNDPPTKYSKSPRQIYIVFVLAMGGIDLEDYEIVHEGERLSIIFQIALSLLVAEERFEFEHRDLHIGNVLIKNCDSKETIRYVINGREFILRSHGVKVSIIDFTNARMKKGETTLYLDLSKDEELFNGEGDGQEGGDYQFDIYRKMRKLNSDNWREFNPATNAMWLHYLARKLFDVPGGDDQDRRRKSMQTFDRLLEPGILIKTFLKDENVVELLRKYTASIVQ